ncbi:hypothetical protein [Sphingomonas sp. DC1600-2]|uniref:hypothetical protein n=1 Tax=unclassified Sphingomonas TaxID=196159 RepID=UPI003CF6A980
MAHKYLKYNSTVENIILLIITAHCVSLSLLSNKRYGEGVEVPGDPLVPINIIARGMGDVLRRVAVGGFAMSLAGCATVSGFPNSAFDTTQVNAEIAPYLLAAKVTAYDSCQAKKACRNDIIDARLRAIDLRFGEYERNLYKEGVGFGVGTDWIALALNGVGSVSAASKALSAASAGVLGARASFEKQALYNMTMPAMLAQMVAKRREVLARIREGESQDVAAYSLFRALNDIDDYAFAGTLPGAITEISNHAGVQATQANADIKAIQIVAPVAQDLQDRREKIAILLKAATAAQLGLLQRVSGGEPSDADPLLNALNLLDAARTTEKLETFCQRFKVAVGGPC